MPLTKRHTPFDKMKKIKLTQGKVALVDDEDFEELNKHKWFIYSIGYAARYIRINKTKRKMISMHRIIMGRPAGMEVDHINHNILDNRKKNLRIVTHGQNMYNMKLSKSNTSGYKGVSWSKTAKKWSGLIQVNNKSIWLGNFKIKEDAAMAYNEAARKYHGEFAKLNKI